MQQCCKNVLFLQFNCKIMNKEYLSRILVKNGLSVTKQRLDILYLFLKNNRPFSKNYLEKTLKYDRVTIFRNLNILTNKGILRKISEKDTGIYVFVKSNERTYHLHFKCKKCNQIFCFENIEFKKNSLPKKFKIDSLEFIAYGLCSDCLVNN